MVTVNMFVYLCCLGTGCDFELFKYLLELKDGVVELFETLPQTSHLRQPLLHFIAQYLPVSLAAQWFHVSCSTIKAARRVTRSSLDSGLLLVERFVSDTQYV